MRSSSRVPAISHRTAAQVAQARASLQPSTPGASRWRVVVTAWAGTRRFLVVYKRPARPHGNAAQHWFTVGNAEGA